MKNNNEKKVLEVFDKGVSNMVVAVVMESPDWREQSIIEQSGFEVKDPQTIMLVDPIGEHAHLSPDKWENTSMRVAHQYIIGFWDSIEPGDVIDVEWLMQEKTEPHKPERYVNSL